MILRKTQYTSRTLKIHEHTQTHKHTNTQIHTVTRHFLTPRAADILREMEPDFLLPPLFLSVRSPRMLPVGEGEREYIRCGWWFRFTS
jgi:hypothetical protein